MRAAVQASHNQTFHARTHACGGAATGPHAPTAPPPPLRRAWAPLHPLHSANAMGGESERTTGLSAASKQKQPSSRAGTEGLAAAASGGNRTRRPQAGCARAWQDLLVDRPPAQLKGGHLRASGETSERCRAFEGSVKMPAAAAIPVCRGRSDSLCRAAFLDIKPADIPMQAQALITGSATNPALSSAHRPVC